ncbi:MAG: hypothetical protein Q9176_004345 [Flavoplaca citrina]
MECTPVGAAVRYSVNTSYTWRLTHFILGVPKVCEIPILLEGDKVIIFLARFSWGQVLKNIIPDIRYVIVIISKYPAATADWIISKIWWMSGRLFYYTFFKVLDTFVHRQPNPFRSSWSRLT